MTTERNTEHSRLYRSRDDRKIAGVAGGLGTYLGVDPVLIRLAIVALALAGIGVLAYIVGWVIIPEEPHPGAAIGTAPARAAARTGSTGNAGARIAVGAVLIGIGLIMLLNWAVPSIDDIAWPLLVIAGGAGLLIWGTRR